MDVNPLNRIVNLPPVSAASSHSVASDQVQAKVVESSKVTAPSSSGDSTSNEGNPSKPGLGEKVDFYDTEATQASTEKHVQNAQTGDPDQNSMTIEKRKEKTVEKKLQLLGNGKDGPNLTEQPPESEFPFLIPLGNKSIPPKPGERLDATG